VLRGCEERNGEGLGELTCRAHFQGDIVPHPVSRGISERKKGAGESLRN